MMTHRVSEGGSFRIDRRFKGVGRIALASGTTNKKRFRAYNVMLSDLHEDGKLDVLRAVQDGRISIQELYQAHRTGRIPYVASDLLLHEKLWPAVEAWVPRSASAEASRKRYAVSLVALKKHGPLGASAKVSDLSGIDWRALRDEWPNSGADWNRMRAAVSRFLSMGLGDKHHPFRRKVMSKLPRARESRGRVPEITPALFWKIVEHSNEHLRPCWVTLAVTGLRVRSEYLALEEHHLRPLTREIEVPGTKTEGSADVVKVGEKAWPWIVAAVPSPLQYKALRGHWKAACEAAGAEGLWMHDLRHFYGQQLVESGQSEASVQTGLRHASPGMTRRYTRRKDHGELARGMDEILFPAPDPKEAEDAG